VLSTGLGWNDTNVWHAWERRELRAEFWKESLKVTIWTTFLDEVKIDLSKEGWKCVGWIIRHMIGKGGGLLLRR